MNILDLFSGIGGFSLAAQRAGFKIEKHYASEIDKYAQMIYRRNFNGSIQLGDVTRIGNDLGKIDIITGGFPCQAFSIAGKRRGFEDTRGTLFFEIARLAKIYEPRFMVLENVKGLMSHEGGKTLKIILETLQSLGYYVNMDLINTKDYGIPQNRERIFFICYHIKELLKDGQNLNLNSLEKITKQYLFQVLLKNLEEVKILQEQKSKEWVLNYLLLKEVINMSGQTQISNFSEKIINQCLVKNSQDLYPDLFPPSIEKKESWDSVENILESIMTTTEGKLYQLEMEDIKHTVDLLLNKTLEENLQEKSKSTILTALKTITNSKTYTFTTMQAIILRGIDHLKNSYQSLWQGILSDLIVAQENTKYARINEKSENRIITEYNTVVEFNDLKSLSSKKFIIDTRGEPQPEISGIRERKTEITTGITAISTRHMGLRGPEYSNNMMPCLTATGYKDQHKISIPVLSPDRVKKRQDGRRFKENGDPSFTLTAQDRHGVLLSDSGVSRKRELRNIAPPLRAHNGCGHDNYTFEDSVIRRLTPVECERLQDYPDNWTKYGIDENGKEFETSDTQRYKCCGNSITVKVAEEIFKEIRKVFS